MIDELIEKENEELRRRSDALLEELGITREYVESHTFSETERELGVIDVVPDKPYRMTCWGVGY